MHPPMFLGVELVANPYGFIEESQRICQALEYMPAQSVELVSFQLKDVTYE